MVQANLRLGEPGAICQLNFISTFPQESHLSGIRDYYPHAQDCDRLVG